MPPSDVRVIEEIEVPDPPTNVVNLDIPQPPARPVQQLAPSPVQMAVIFKGIAAILAADLQCLALVLAMIGLSAVAIINPTDLRLIGAAGFDVFGLLGIWTIQQRIPKRGPPS